MIPARLLRAYRQTEYSAAGCVVMIGRHVPDRLLRLLGSRSAVFVTAWNPMSRRFPDGWNDRAQRRLRERLRRFRSLPGDGRLGHWHEAHLLVGVADFRPVVHVARVFRQRAIVVVRAAHPAQLVLLGYRRARSVMMVQAGNSIAASNYPRLRQCLVPMVAIRDPFA
jgi:hypothetical protein